MTAEQMSRPVVACRGVRYSYGALEVVRGIDLEVRPGVLFALLGTNGAGKTTTMELLLGQRRPGGGTVRVLGREPYRERRRLAAEVGVVLQEGGCAPDLTVAETVRTWLRLHRRRHVVRTATALLEQLRLDHRAAVRVRQLSGGERRRLDLTVALCGEPRLLLLDEPTAGLDPESREQTWEILRERLRAGITMVITTHYLEEAEAVADQVAIMHAGKVAVAGSLDEVRGAGSLADAFHRIARRTGTPGPADPPKAVDAPPGRRSAGWSTTSAGGEGGR